MIWLACVLSAILLCIYFYKSGKVDRTSSIGKCVLITGCDSGLGLSMALTAHAMGFKVVAICLSDSSYGALLLKEKCHENVLVLQTDVTIPDQVNQAVENVSEVIECDLISNSWVIVIIFLAPFENRHTTVGCYKQCWSHGLWAGRLADRGASFGPGWCQSCGCLEGDKGLLTPSSEVNRWSKKI